MSAEDVLFEKAFQGFMRLSGTWRWRVSGVIAVALGVVAWSYAIYQTTMDHAALIALQTTVDSSTLRRDETLNAMRDALTKIGTNLESISKRTERIEDKLMGVGKT